MTWGPTGAWLVALGVLVGVGTSLAAILMLVRRATRASIGLDAWEHFERTLDTELERARREERPVTLIRIAIDGDARGTRAALDRLTVRRLDHVFVLADAALLIAPGADRRSRAALMDRIMRAHDGQRPASLRVATFPDEGLSSGALFARLERPEGLATPPRPRPQPVAPERFWPPFAPEPGVDGKDIA